MNSYNEGLNYVDDSKIDLIISKEQLFNNIEIVLGTNIVETLDKLLEGYDSSNSNSFSSLQSEINNKLLLMQKNHKNNLDILIKNKEKYIDTSMYVSRLFDDI